MGVLTFVIGSGVFGTATRMMALGIQKKNLLSGRYAHAMNFAAFGAIGYWLHGVQERQEELIQQRKNILLANRRKRQEGISSQAEV